MPDVVINGPEGRLEGRYHHSKQTNAPIALLLHPHPQHGGTMNHRVVYTLYHAFVRCGFSALVVQILDHLGADYATVNVLSSDELRNGIKSFSNWPTIPQLYVKGEFVGGCDIVKEMFQAGELKTLLAEKGVLEA